MWTTANSAAMNIAVHVSSQIIVFSGYMQESDLNQDLAWPYSFRTGPYFIPPKKTLPSEAELGTVKQEGSSASKTLPSSFAKYRGAPFNYRSSSSSPLTQYKWKQFLFNHIIFPSCQVCKCSCLAILVAKVQGGSSLLDWADSWASTSTPRHHSWHPAPQEKRNTLWHLHF